MGGLCCEVGGEVVRGLLACWWGGEEEEGSWELGGCWWEEVEEVGVVWESGGGFFVFGWGANVFNSSVGDSPGSRARRSEGSGSWRFTWWFARLPVDSQLGQGRLECKKASVVQERE